MHKNITRSREDKIVEIWKTDDGDVSVKQIHAALTTPAFEYTPEEAVQIADALLEAAGRTTYSEYAEREKAIRAADGATHDEEAEAAEHARQRAARAMDHAFDRDSLSPAEVYVWVHRPGIDGWMGLWDRGRDRIAPFVGGLTEDGRRRAFALIGVPMALPWAPAEVYRPFEIAVFA